MPHNSANSVDAVQLLSALVAIPSPSRNEGQAVSYLVDWMARHGFTSYVDDIGNAVGTRGKGEREILLLGHIDTVPGTIEVRVEGDRLFGRGTVDAKGPLAAFAAAAASVSLPTGYRVTVVGAVEEEISTSRGARHCLATQTNPPEFCIIGEPSRWDRVALGYKGRLVLDAELYAPLAHSAGPSKLPPEHGVELWALIQTFCLDRNTSRNSARVFDEVSPTLQQIASRDQGTHGTVGLTVGFRLPPTEDPVVLQTDLTHALTEYVSQIPDLQLTCQFKGAEPGFCVSKSTPLVRAFLKSVRDRGGAPRFVVKTGTSDMNVVGPHWTKTAMLAYGPGDSALDHTPNEHIDLAEYENAVAVLSQVLQQLAGDPNGAGAA